MLWQSLYNQQHELHLKDNHPIFFFVGSAVSFLQRYGFRLHWFRLRAHPFDYDQDNAAAIAFGWHACL